jgi:hypothetical protein
MLAKTLLYQNRYSEAEEACHTAIKLVPRHPWPYYYLAQIMRFRGKTREAEAWEHEAERLRPSIVSDQRILPSERAALLAPKLPEWLNGKAKPADALELTILGYMAAHNQKRFDTVVKLFGKSFAEQPAFAEATVAFPSDRPRYFAACCAAQASLGQGDGVALEPEERGQHRRQSVEWLHQELAYWNKQMVDRQPAAAIRAYSALSYWRGDGWLAGVRDVEITDKLPPAEKEACRKLWNDVAEVLKRASAGLDKGNAKVLEPDAKKLRPRIVSELRMRPSERVALLAPKLQEWLNGKAKPADALELTILGYMAAHNQKKFDTVAQLFGKSFAEQPAFAEATVEFSSDRPRYFAACCAAQASLGQGDGVSLTLEERRQRRRQALEWLRQELAYWNKQTVDRQPAAAIRAYSALSYWREDGWLAGVRDVGITDKLPLADKEACRKLWNDVAELLKRASAGLDKANQDKQGR